MTTYGSGEVACPVCGVALDVELELVDESLLVDPPELITRVRATAESMAELREHLTEHGPPYTPKDPTP